MSTTPEGKEALLPCPFCGASASGYGIDPHAHALRLGDFQMPDHPGSYVIEGDCACGSGLIGATREEVTERWNRRAATPSALPVAPENEAACKSCSSALFVTPKLVVYGSNAAIDALAERLKRLAPQSPAPEAALVDAAAGYFLRAGFDPSGDGTKRWEQVADEFKNDADVVPLYERATLSAGKGAA